MKNIPKEVIGTTIVYIILIITAIYTLIPLLTVVMTSIRSEADLYKGPFSFPKEIVIFKNFQKTWISGKFSIYLKNSILLTLPTVVIVISTSTLAGYAFAKIHFIGNQTLFYIFLVGMMIPFQAVMIPIYIFLHRIRLLDTIIGASLVIGSFICAFGIFMMRSFFKDMPDELIEAAKLDGCSDLQTFLNIMLPLTFPAWTSLIIFTAMWTWNNFLIPLLVLFSDNKRPLPLALMNFQDRYTQSYTLIAAAVLITIFPLIVLFLFLQRKFIKSITLGAIKG